MANRLLFLLMMVCAVSAMPMNRCAVWISGTGIQLLGNEARLAYQIHKRSDLKKADPDDLKNALNQIINDGIINFKDQLPGYLRYPWVLSLYGELLSHYLQLVFDDDRFSNEGAFSVLLEFNENDFSFLITAKPREIWPGVFPISRTEALPSWVTDRNFKFKGEYDTGRDYFKVKWRVERFR